MNDVPTVKQPLSAPYSIASLIKGLRANAKATPEVLLSELLGTPHADTPQPRLRMGSRTALLPDEGFARALGATSASQGADLIVASVARVAAAARPQLALDVAGVSRLELKGTGPISLPSWVPEVTPGGWIGEGGHAAENQLTVKTVDATPKSCYAYLDLSRELQKAVPMIEADVLVELARATRNVLEVGFINGLGNQNQPLGLLRTPGASRNSWAAATPTRPELITTLQHFSEAHGNLGAARWVLNSDLTARMLASEVAASTGVFNLAIDNARPTILGVPAIISEAMPDNRILLFDPSTVRMVFWNTPSMLADPFTFDTSGTLRLLIYNDCDIVTLQQAQLAIGEGA